MLEFEESRGGSVGGVDGRSAVSVMMVVCHHCKFKCRRDEFGSIRIESGSKPDYFASVEGPKTKYCGLANTHIAFLIYLQ